MDVTRSKCLALEARVGPCPSGLVGYVIRVVFRVFFAVEAIGERRETTATFKMKDSSFNLNGASIAGTSS
jgi:hypothetical protein